MTIEKKIIGDELYLYMDGELIFKRWLKDGYSKVFDKTAYDKYSHISYTEYYTPTNDLIIIKAKLKLYTTENGGRQTGCISGYRPNHVFEYKENNKFTTYIGDILFEGESPLNLGEEKIVTVRFALCQPIEEYLNIGRKWWIHEGARLVGEAEILAFVNYGK